MSNELHLRMKTALGAGNWADALLIGKERSSLGTFSILRSFIIAAREAGDASALELAETVCSSGQWNKAQRYSLAREFVAANRPQAAWYALNGAGDHADDPGFAKQARRICVRMPNGPLRREITRAIKLATKGGSRARFAPSEVHFPPAEHPPLAMSKIFIAASPSVPERHLVGVEKHVTQYFARLNRPLPPRVEEIFDVFVDGEGQIWGEKGEVFKDTGKPKPLSSRDEVSVIDCGFHFIKPTRGIYHWLVDRVPHLTILDSSGAEDARVLLSTRGPAFENATLSLAGFPESRSLRVGKPVFVRRLLRPRVGFAGMRHWERVAPIIDRIKIAAEAIAQRHGVQPLERIYISRRDSDRRIMINERDVETLMVGRGYTVLAMSELPLWQQIFLISNARQVVSPHGAGLAHIIFLRQDASVTEILPIQDGTYVLRLNYAILSAVRSLKYRTWIEGQFATGDKWSTDIDEFDRFLDTDAL